MSGKNKISNLTFLDISLVVGYRYKITPVAVAIGT